MGGGCAKCIVQRECTNSVRAKAIKIIVPDRSNLDAYVSMNVALFSKSSAGVQVLSLTHHWAGCKVTRSNLYSITSHIRSAMGSQPGERSELVPYHRPAPSSWERSVWAKAYIFEVVIPHCT